MTQKIFKKSNKEDMKLLFSILPDEVKYIEKTIYSKYDIRIELLTKKLFGNVSISQKYTDYNFYNLLNIDFETDKPEEMIIKRPMEEDNDK